MVPQRRQSIATNPTAFRPRSVLGKKRSASIAPGETQALEPRKSILKSAFTFNINQQSSQDAAFPTSSSAPDNESNDTDENNFTVDLHDHTGRKSLSRRVSFAPHAQVRVFEINEQNTNSSGSPSSSPAPSPSRSDDSPQVPSPDRASYGPPRLSNENDYPGRARRNSITNGSRRDSALSENGEKSMSMDLDGLVPDGFHLAGRVDLPDDIVEDADDYDDGDEDDDVDMEITEAIALNIQRKRSLSWSQQQAAARRLSRRRSSFNPAASSSRRNSAYAASGGANESQDGETPMEFTVPLATALNKPKPPTDAWLALQAVAGTTGDDGQSEDMELTNALSRLERVRASLGEVEEGDNSAVSQESGGEGSFTSTDDSADSVDVSDRTMNLTGILGGVRNMEISGTNSVSTMEDGDAEEDENIARRISLPPTTANSTSGPQPSPPSIGVFSAPSPVSGQPTVAASANVPSQSSSKAPPSPFSKLRPPSTGVFSSLSSPASASPRRGTTPTRSSTLTVSNPVTSTFRSPSPNQTTTGAITTPMKRPASPSIVQDSDDAPLRPSPAKRLATGLGIAAPEARAKSPARSPGPSKTPPVSPMKGKQATEQAQEKSSTAVRRPSGYFAQRRSLAPGVAATSALSTAPSPSPAVSPAKGKSPMRPLPMRLSMSPVKPAARRLSVTLPSPVHTGRAVSRPPVIKVNAPDGDDVIDEDEEDIVEEDQAEDATTQWREGVVHSEVTEESIVSVDMPSILPPPISIEQFFMMTGVKFMDELTVPRRSTVHPSQLRNRRDSEPTPQPSVSELAEAIHVSVPQLELYSWVVKDLQTWIGNSKKIYTDAEDEVAKVVPGLFREFSLANEEGRAALLHQLKLIKANKHSAAKEQWYDWKYQWVANLYETADKGCSALEADKERLTNIISRSDELLPVLRQQHTQILLELEQERKDIADIEASDPAYLEELKAEIDEQNALLDVYRTDVGEGKAKIEKLREKLAEMEAQKNENERAIDEAQRKIQLHKNSTRAEVFRLKDELESLQALHSWRATKVQPQSLELVFDEQFRLSIPCSKYCPLVGAGTGSIEIARLEIPRKLADAFPSFSEVVLRSAQHYTASIAASTTKEIIERLGDFWTSCAQIRSQLTFLAVKYPLTVEVASSSEGNDLHGVRVSASLLLRKAKAKALVSFFFKNDTLAKWPFALRSLKCDVQIVYGKADPQVLREALMGRLSQATPEDNHACLLDACVEASTRYD